jgi:16S rRNA (adenine(1408)-N(1))-methyltransferase
MSGVILDIGTGDGRFTYQLARENPDRLIIGIDPATSPLENLSAKIYKKPSKGGVPNALYVIAQVEDLPQELTGVANQIFINFPWSGLLKGVVSIDERTWGNIKRVCQPQAYIDLICGYDPTFEQKIVDQLALPPLSLDYIRQTMLPKLENMGFKALHVQAVGKEDLKDFPSSWSKRLSFGVAREYFYVQLQLTSG